MHDCRKFKEQLVDLLFESAGADERSRLCRELNSCESCQNLYRSMSETLTAFDQVAETALPEEAYWSGYDERLRARLKQQEPPQQRLFAALFEKISLARFPLPLRVAVACLIVAAGLWLMLNQFETANTPAPAVVNNNEPVGEQKEFAENKRPEMTERKPGHTIAQSPRRATRQIARERKPDKALDPVRDFSASERRAASADYLNPEVASHVEQAEMLMRSFRNVKPSQEQTAYDVSYEKQLSKELLARNRRLRRSAENRRNLAVGDLLTGIEPLLLDIANLPDSPTQDDVHSIKDLIQRQEVVAALQFYSAKASSRNY